VAEISIVALLAVLFARVLRWSQAMRAVQVSASALLVFGMVWFFLRLRS
jgi:hypothetical protein